MAHQPRRSLVASIAIALALSLVVRGACAQATLPSPSLPGTASTGRSPADADARANARADAPPPLAREFRAVWVASVDNIDWPSRPGLSTWQQQAELIEILNRAVELDLNAVILQVRPAGDALYLCLELGGAAS